MRPLEENYRLFVVLCICPSAKSINCLMKMFNILISISCIFIEFIALIASFAFVLKYFSINLEIAICACYQIGAGFIVIYSLITAFIKRDDFKETFERFQDFYDTSKLK